VHINFWVQFLWIDWLNISFSYFYLDIGDLKWNVWREILEILRKSQQTWYYIWYWRTVCIINLCTYFEDRRYCLIVLKKMVKTFETVEKENELGRWGCLQLTERPRNETKTWYCKMASIKKSTQSIQQATSKNYIKFNPDPFLKSPQIPSKIHYSNSVIETFQNLSQSLNSKLKSFDNFFAKI
jgi:hypothetical protein